MLLYSSLLLIYITAIFFWSRLFYKRSLKTTEDRANLLESLKKISLFLPLGLQGILLFHFAVIQTIPLSNKIAGFFEFILFRDSEAKLPYFEPAKIIFVGALLLAVQLLLLKTEFSSQTLNFFFKVVVFMASVFFLRDLAGNIFHSLSLYFSFIDSPIISYNNNYLWLFSAVVFLVVAIIKASLENKTEMNTVKSLGLAAGVLMLYSLLVFILALPLIIFVIIDHG